MSPYRDLDDEDDKLAAVQGCINAFVLMIAVATIAGFALYYFFA